MRTFVPIIEHKTYKLKNFTLKHINSYATYVLHLIIEDKIAGYVDTTTPTTVKETEDVVFKYFCVKNLGHQRIGKITFEYKRKNKRWRLKKAEIHSVASYFLIKRKVLTEKNRSIKKNANRM